MVPMPVRERRNPARVRVNGVIVPPVVIVDVRGNVPAAVEVPWLEVVVAPVSPRVPVIAGAVAITGHAVTKSSRPAARVSRVVMLRVRRLRQGEGGPGRQGEN